MNEARKKEFVRGNMKDFENEMSKILTAEQFIKFKEVKKKHEKDRKPE